MPLDKAHQFPGPAPDVEIIALPQRGGRYGPEYCAMNR